MTPHLRGNVRAYVDRTLPAPLLDAFDRHLVWCGTCRAAADQERRIVAALRSDTGMPQGLRSSLLGLATIAPTAPVGSADHPGPDVPAPPVGFRIPPAPARQPVPTVAPTAPALHRSPVRAAVLASLAAGASVAAAWSLAVVPQQAAAPTRVPAGLLPGVASFRAPTTPAGFGAVTAGGPMGRARVTSSAPWLPRLDAAVRAVEEESVRIALASSAQSGP
ncbi:MAG TPA: hypothetical protein VFJ94_08840 [Intrasporangium sp.]|uniref:hypothetical protein n=1 Tax=Intrasporangium sp. TaxID=1925024 RepID=UPI002D772F67|nr:hypothetical protein [Intrasporangium sp.]HET7398615.1 hypothetical protein [Intrasporangium sp.]